MLNFLIIVLFMQKMNILVLSCSTLIKIFLPVNYQELTYDFGGQIAIYFIPSSSEFNAYLKQIKVILSAVKKYRILSLVTNTIYIFSL